jgi:NAD-dependent SIR2 family protein deacetylase
MGSYHERIVQFVELLKSADAIVVGGGSGLSSAAGYNHYHWSGALLEDLEPFYEHYGFQSPFAGFYHCYSSPEEQWAYYAAYIKSMQEASVGKPYQILKKLLGDIPYFILTTNVDMQFSKLFPAENICTFQGSFKYFQCSQPCHDKTYENRELIDEMCHHTKDFRIPSELVPRCPECGWKMVPWVRDDTFLEGRDWTVSVERYHNFLRQWLMLKPNSRVLLLELGVGEMTPTIIKLLFWEMTEKNENVFYVCMNQKKSGVPEHIRDRSLYIAGDIAEVLWDALWKYEEAGVGMKEVVNVI